MEQLKARRVPVVYGYAYLMKCRLCGHIKPARLSKEVAEGYRAAVGNWVKLPEIEVALRIGKAHWEGAGALCLGKGHIGIQDMAGIEPV